MAFAAVASLLQTLDCWLKLPRLFLEMKKIQVRILLRTWPDLWTLLTHRFDELSQEETERLSSLLDLIQIARGKGKTYSYLDEVGSSIPSNISIPAYELLDCLVDLFCNGLSQWTQLSQILGPFHLSLSIYEIQSLVSLLNFICEGGMYGINLELQFGGQIPDLIEEKHQILEKLQYLMGGLKKLWVFGDCPIAEEISLARLNQAAAQLLEACQKMEADLILFYEVCMNATNLYRDFQLLLTKLDDSSNKCKWDDNGLLKHIKDVADRARDPIEECLADNQIVINGFIEASRRSHSGAPRGSAAQLVQIAFVPNKGIHQTLQELSKEMQSIKVELEAVTGKTRNIYDEILSLELRSTSLMDAYKEESMVGFDDEQVRILEELTRMRSGLEIVTIVGMGGIGKTTLAKKLFNHPRTVYHFYCRAWITISQVHQARDLLLGLLSSFAEKMDKMIEKSNAELAQDLYRSLKGKRYLIVMDDMWSLDAWNDLRICFPDDKIGSRVMVTSRFTEVANRASPQKPPHFMNLLDTERSWELLEKLVFGIASCSVELVEVGKQIARRCQGLPLAIVVIAGILSRSARTLDSWKHIADNLSSLVSTDPEQCLDILALSYIYLPHHLRACFLYMGAFPEDCDIEAEKLIDLWVAEGFICSDNPKYLEQIAKDCLEDLIRRNLVLVEKRHFGGNGKVKSCRLHDFIREVCLREAQKENFMNVVQKGRGKNFPAGTRSQRRLSFHLDPYSDVAAAPTLPRVSSFLCFSLGSDIVPDILFFELGFKLLRVLDIYFLHFGYFPEQVVTLFHLRYLALNVTFKLPATMSRLRNLQTFVIQGPWPVQESNGSPTLFLEYWTMPSLRHLHCSVASHLLFPRSVQEDRPKAFAPEYLQTLSKIRFSSCRKEVFTSMSGLKRLEVHETKDDYNSDKSCVLLNNLVYLQDLQTLKCCFYLQNCEARCLSCMDAFPSTLRQLSLSRSYLPWKDMTTIAMLPNLEVLKLKNYAFEGPEWVPAEVGFPRLKYLLIVKTNLVRWEATVDQFQCLKQLILKSCKHLEEIPFGVEDIGSLERFESHYCSKWLEVLAKDIQEQIEGIDVVIQK